MTLCPQVCAAGHAAAHKDMHRVLPSFQAQPWEQDLKKGLPCKMTSSERMLFNTYLFC